MCKILQQAESHFMDFQSLHLAMIASQHVRYDRCSKNGVVCVEIWSGGLFGSIYSTPQGVNSEEAVF